MLDRTQNALKKLGLQDDQDFIIYVERWEKEAPESCQQQNGFNEKQIPKIRKAYESK